MSRSSDVRRRNGQMSELPRFAELVVGHFPQGRGGVGILRTSLWLDLAAVREVNA